MKVIDLLNKIANGEPTPKRFKIELITYDFNNSNARLDYELFNGLQYEDYNLDSEVEVVEEAPEGDNKIEKLDVVLLGQCDNWLQPTIDTDEKIRAELNPYIIDVIRENTLVMQRKINEIINKINGE